MCRTHFSEYFEYSDNILIINMLQLNPPFLSSNTLKNPPTFRFLFRYSSYAINYTLLNISTEANSLFLHFPLRFYFQRTVFKFSAHSAENCSALEIKLQCAVEKKTVRWKFENLVVFSKNSSPEINKCKRTAPKRNTISQFPEASRNVRRIPILQ